MSGPRFWRWVLFAAAAYNLVVGVAGLLTPGASPDARVVGLLVACFGGIYALTATDVQRFRPMLWLGVIGKLGVIAIVGPLVARGAQPPAVGALLVGDALFTLAFLALLLRAPSGWRAPR